MNIAIGMSWCAMASLITLYIATRIGIHDVRAWITPQTQQQLRSIGLTWQGLAIASACIIAWAADPKLAASPHDIAEVEASFLLVHFLLSGALCGVFAGLLCALARMDMACRLLPDRLTLLLIATGFAFHFLSHVLETVDALIGAAAGYGALWLFAWLFQRLRKTDAMGRGDFAMTAGLGAWLGWQSLPLVLMTASAASLAVIATHHLFATRNITSRPAGPKNLLRTETAFGPALAFGGLAAWAMLAMETTIG